MPLHQTLHRLSTKVKKIISNQQQQHYRLRVPGSQTENPLNLHTDTLEEPATSTSNKSKEKEKEFRHHHNPQPLSLWSSLKLKPTTQSVSGMQFAHLLLLLVLNQKTKKNKK
jgi:hypothetical protein